MDKVIPTNCKACVKCAWLPLTITAPASVQRRIIASFVFRKFETKFRSMQGDERQLAFIPQAEITAFHPLIITAGRPARIRRPSVSGRPITADKRQAVSVVFHHQRLACSHERPHPSPNKPFPVVGTFQSIQNGIVTQSIRNYRSSRPHPRYVFPATGCIPVYLQNIRLSW
jgi:hypothetical protein